MKFKFVILLFLLGCSNVNYKEYLFNDSDLKQLDKRLASRDIFGNDTIRFNDFQEYCRVIHDIELPFNGNFENFVNYSPIVQISLQKCNYGVEGNLPIGKIMYDNYLAIFYSLPIEGTVIDLIIFNLKGQTIDSMRFYKSENSYDKNETSYISKDFIITKVDSTKKSSYRLLKDGKIKKE